MRTDTQDMTYRLSLVIPIFNEEKNIEPLISDIAKTRQSSRCPHELVLVNNGSQDRSAEEIAHLKVGKDWIKTITLQTNQGYGGGIQAGLSNVSPLSTHVGWIPADLQYSIQDLQKVWTQTTKIPRALHKGQRTVRLDGAQTRFVSTVYTYLYRLILGLRVKDVNGLPKIFPVELYHRIDFPLSHTFVLDGQLILAAELYGLPVHEHPVTFFARRSGVSSWSSKRLKVYRDTILELFQIQKQSAKWFTSKIASTKRELAQ